MDDQSAGLELPLVIKERTRARLRKRREKGKKSTGKGEGETLSWCSVDGRSEDSKTSSGCSTNLEYEDTGIWKSNVKEQQTYVCRVCEDPSFGVVLSFEQDAGESSRASYEAEGAISQLGLLQGQFGLRSQVS
jgi:hypothetical protein